jgi:hypothetical protein
LQSNTRREEAWQDLDSRLDSTRLDSLNLIAELEGMERSRVPSVIVIGME